MSPRVALLGRAGDGGGRLWIVVDGDRFAVLGDCGDMAAGRQAADSCGQVLDLLLLLLLCLDKKPEYAGMGIYGPVMMTRSWIGAND